MKKKLIDIKYDLTDRYISRHKIYVLGVKDYSDIDTGSIDDEYLSYIKSLLIEEYDEEKRETIISIIIELFSLDIPNLNGTLHDVIHRNKKVK